MWAKQPDLKPPTVRELPVAAAAERIAPLPELRAEGARLTQGLVVKGEVSGREDLHVDGELCGSIRLPDSRVTLGPNSLVVADIEANEIIVEGHVEGNLRARTRVELRRSSRVRGDLAAQRIAIQEGALFNGKVELVRPEQLRPHRAAAADLGPEPFPISLGTAAERKEKTRFNRE